MAMYKLYNISWDAEYDVELPNTVIMSSNYSIEEMLDGCAADWLADNYGFCVNSLLVDEVPSIEEKYDDGEVCIRIRARMNEITEFEKDESMIRADYSHCSCSDVYDKLKKETLEKMESDSYIPPNVPFDCWFTMKLDEYERKEELEEEYELIRDRMLEIYIDAFMNFDYIIPVDCSIDFDVMKEDGEWRSVRNSSLES